MKNKQIMLANQGHTLNSGTNGTTIAQKYQPLINNAGIISPQQNFYAQNNNRGFSSNGTRSGLQSNNSVAHGQQNQMGTISGIMTPTGATKNMFSGQNRKNSRPANNHVGPTPFVPSVQQVLRADSRTGTKVNQLKQRATSSSKRQQQVHMNNIYRNMGNPHPKQIIYDQQSYSTLNENNFLQRQAFKNQNQMQHGKKTNNAVGVKKFSHQPPNSNNVGGMIQKNMKYEDYQMLTQGENIVFDPSKVGMHPQIAQKGPKPIEIIDQQNQAYYSSNLNSEAPSRTAVIANQFKILTPQNNINIRGNLIPQMPPSQQQKDGRRAYSNLRGDSQSKGAENFGANEIRVQSRVKQRTVSRPRGGAHNDSGQFATIDGTAYQVKRTQNAEVDNQPDMYQRNVIQGNKGTKNYETIQQTQGIVYQNSAKIKHYSSKQRNNEDSPQLTRENNSDYKKQIQQQKGGGFVDNFKTNICKEQAKRLIFSNSNALLESEQVVRDNEAAKATKTRHKNMDIVSTNHQLLIDQQITTSNMLGSHQNNNQGMSSAPRGRHTDQGQAIHINDQSMEKEGNNFDQTRTDDLAASSPTIEEIQTQDVYRFGKHSGALIVASATSDFSQVSENGGDISGDAQGGLRSMGGRNQNDIKIMTGAYSLNKNSIVNDQIFSESFMKENQNCVDQDHFYGIPPQTSEVRAGTSTTYQGGDIRLHHTVGSAERKFENGDNQNFGVGSTQTYQMYSNHDLQGNSEMMNNQKNSNWRPAGQPMTQNNSNNRINNGSQMGKNGKKGQRADGGIGQIRGQSQGSRSNPRSGIRTANKNSNIPAPLSQNNNQFQVNGKGSKTGGGGSNMRNITANFTISPQSNAYGEESNQNFAAMNNDSSQRQNQNQTQIQRNNFLITGGNVYTKAGMNNPSRDLKNNTDMRAGGGGGGPTIAQGNNIMRWQYGGGGTGGTTKNQQRAEQHQTLDVGGKTDLNELQSNNIGGALYTQVNSPMYNKQNYPGMPKTTTNRQHAARSGKQQQMAPQIEQRGIGQGNFNNMLYQQKQAAGKNKGAVNKMLGDGSGDGSKTIQVDQDMLNSGRNTNTIMATVGNKHQKVIGGNYFHQKRQTQFQMKGGPGILSDNHLTTENSMLDTNKDNGIVTKKNGNNSKGLVFTNRQKSGKSNSTMRGGGGERSISNIQGNIQTIKNIQAIDNYIDNQINIKSPGGGANQQQKTPGGGTYYGGKGAKNTVMNTNGQKTRAITQIRKNSTLQGGQKTTNTVGLTSPVRGPDHQDGRQQMFSALQNPTGPPLDQHAKGLISIKANNYGNVKSGGQLENINKDVGDVTRSPDKRGNMGYKNNFFIKVSEKKNDPHKLNNQNGYDQQSNLISKPDSEKKPQIFENKKLSQSYVVYHQMKKNLMQTNGVLGRGSRYQPGILGATSPVSEENFDDQFLQLDNNVNKNQKSSIKEDQKGMNALEQALQDHLNKEKYDKQLMDNNFEKYHLRVKNVGNHQQMSENKTAATNSSGGNYMNFRSRKLVIRTTTDQNNKQMKSAEEDEEHERQRMELSGILCSSINDFSSQAIAKNRFQKNKNDQNAGGNTKISNQNALLSLLSQDDFKDLKQQIHGKITDVTGPEGQDSLIIQERNDETEIKAQGADIDAQSQGVLSQAENN